MPADEDQTEGTAAKRARVGRLLPPAVVASDVLDLGFGLPPAGPISGAQGDIEDIWKLHEEACSQDNDFYTDPATGYLVMTRISHDRRGKCCGSGCRHCPYSYTNVRSKTLADKIQQPAFLHVGAGERKFEALAKQEVETKDAGVDAGVVVLFWSGGKDSFLTLRALTRLGHEVVLITTFDAATRVIANQEMHISLVERQARHLDVSLVGIPLHPGTEYVDRLKAGLEVVRGRPRRVVALAFGDLHLQHIRDWREDRLGPAGLGQGLGAEAPVRLYPLWQRPYEELHEDLEASGVPCEVSALGPRISPAGLLKVGAPFGRALAEEVSRAGMDAFGEKGEFHSLAKVWEVTRARALGLAEP
eukprot:CAMPEP_0203904420 /NCGR_PEP_ID=MMETSP0359-20131031/46259_1 /ASSEMBLY_ACC=CAM_ASM_000338 /TAXON_ID=268821 /ORGANISM="Scrippsiella Hangoei, Strain SHTV-5" /LENGTH=359 /DNA_ID=CAMNT_0050828657 /DNA_START=116 /DNA_END=1195 /DNA_ORIENTATION=-